MFSIPDFVEQVILGGCVDAVIGERVTDEQFQIAHAFLAQYDKGQWGRTARRQLRAHMAEIIAGIDDVATPKQGIAIQEPVPHKRNEARGNAAGTDVMRGFGAGFMMVRKGKA